MYDNMDVENLPKYCMTYQPLIVLITRFSPHKLKQWIVTNPTL